MPLFFKIILFLILQQSLRSDSEGRQSDSHSVQGAPLMSKTFILYLEGDESMVENAIGICQQGMPIAVNRYSGTTSGTTKAVLAFTSLGIETKNTMTNQLIQQMQGRFKLEWREGD